MSNGWSCSAATSSSSARKRRPRRSAALGAPSSRGSRGRSIGCARSSVASMDELERDLARLGAELDYPPAPDIAARLGERIGGGPRRSGYRLRRVAGIAPAALGLPAGAGLAPPPP